MRGGTRSVAALAALVVVLSGCQLAEPIAKKLSGGKTASGTPGAAGASVGGGQVLKLKRYSCIDGEGTGLEAFSMLVPEGWRFRGGIRWVLDRPGSPAEAAFTVTAPDGSAEFEVLPNQNFVWTNNATTLALFPVGSKYFGMEVRQPMQALPVLLNIVIPRFRGREAGLTVVSQQDLPELGKAVASAMQHEAGVAKSATGAKARIEYQRGSKRIEEEMYAASETSTFTVASVFRSNTTTLWAASYLFACKAEKGKLDADARLFQTIAFSFRLNPQWFNRYVQLIQMLAQQQIQQIHTIGQISRMIAQTSDQISEDRMRQWEADQARRDRINESFGQYVRGVDEYYDPVAGKNVELPSGYDNAWTNPLGEYVVSDSPSFNPNLDSNLHWQQIQRTRP